MALNVKDIEVMEEKTNVLDHILFCLFWFILLSCMLFLVIEIAVNMSFHFEKPSFVKHVMFSL